MLNGGFVMVLKTHFFLLSISSLSNIILLMTGIIQTPIFPIPRKTYSLSKYKRDKHIILIMTIKISGFTFMAIT